MFNQAVSKSVSQSNLEVKNAAARAGQSKYKYISQQIVIGEMYNYFVKLAGTI